MIISTSWPLAISSCFIQATLNTSPLLKIRASMLGGHCPNKRTPSNNLVSSAISVSKVLRNNWSANST